MELALMQDADIFVKTDAGRDEIKSRTLGLSMSMRAILLMIDGQRTVAAMRSIIAGSKAPADVLDTLAAQGLIEPRSAPTPAAPPAAPPISIPRAAPRAAAPTPIAAPTISGSTTSFVYDGPLDLTLPTIDGPDLADAVAQPVVEAEPVAVPANHYEQLYGMMNEIVRDFLSPTRRYFFQLKIERCGTAEELLELLRDLQAALAKARGDAFAAEVIARLRSAIN